MNIGALLPRHARYRPDHLALVVGDRRLTYRKLNAVVNRLANALLTNGITKGEKIATILPNCLELMMAYWAAAKTGIVIVPMSTLLQDHGLATLLRDSDSVAVLAEASFAKTLDRIRGDVQALQAGGLVLVGCQGEAPPGFRTYEELRRRSSRKTIPRILRLQLRRHRIRTCYGHRPLSGSIARDRLGAASSVSISVRPALTPAPAL